MIFVALAFVFSISLWALFIGAIAGEPLLRTGGLLGVVVSAAAFFAVDAWRAKWQVRWLRWRVQRRTEVIKDIDYQLDQREPLGLTQRELDMLFTARSRYHRRRARLLARLGVRGYAESLRPEKRRVA